jgi:hypothetical protein
LPQGFPTGGCHEEEIGTYQQVIDQFQDSADIQLQRSVASAMLNQGVAFGSDGKVSDEARMYDRVIERLEGARQLSTRDGLYARSQGSGP